MGTVIAWSTVTLGFIRFYRAEGTLLKFTNCALPNPLTTLCFYGAIAFVLALLWAVSLASGAKPAGTWLRRSVVALTGFDNLRVEQRGVRVLAMGPEPDWLHRELHDRVDLQPIPVALSLWVDDVLGGLAERRSHRSCTAATSRPVQRD